MNVKEMQELLARHGHHYGTDAAENALVGYKLAGAPPQAGGAQPWGWALRIELPDGWKGKWTLATSDPGQPKDWKVVPLYASPQEAPRPVTRHAGLDTLSPLAQEAPRAAAEELERLRARVVAYELADSEVIVEAADEELQPLLCIHGDGEEPRTEEGGPALLRGDPELRVKLLSMFRSANEWATEVQKSHGKGKCAPACAAAEAAAAPVRPATDEGEKS